MWRLFCCGCCFLLSSFIYAFNKLKKDIANSPLTRLPAGPNWAGSLVRQCRFMCLLNPVLSVDEHNGQETENDISLGVTTHAFACIMDPREDYSKQFWKLLRKYCPSFRLNHKAARLRLRKQFHSLWCVTSDQPVILLQILNVSDLSPFTADNPGCNTAVWQQAKSREDLVHIANNRNEGKEKINRLSSFICHSSFWTLCMMWHALGSPTKSPPTLLHKLPVVFNKVKLAGLQMFLKAWVGL